MPAAQAVYCAGQQDPQYFWDLHDWIFANQAGWAQAQDAAARFRAQAVSLGADGARYDACLSAPATNAAIQRDLDEGSRMGVRGTPAFFVNDWFIEGAYPFQEFQDKIEKALSGIHPPPTPTPLPPGVAPYDADPARPGRTYDGSPSLGDPKARLVLIAFEDFKCGYCAQHFNDVEPTLRSKYVNPGQLRLVFKFFPIYAPEAAVASLCAADQNQFWEFHDTLLGKQAEWQEGDDAAMLAYARSLGLDEVRFSQCLKDAPGQAQVEADYQLGQQLGVRGTPYFLLLDLQQQVGTRIPGALPLDQFEEAIQDLLSPPAPTP
jgi:protein-disulfide isomerase